METSSIGWPPWLTTLLIPVDFWTIIHAHALGIDMISWSNSEYQNVTNQSGHPIALVSMVTTLCENRLFKTEQELTLFCTVDDYGMGGGGSFQKGGAYFLSSEKWTPKICIICWNIYFRWEKFPNDAKVRLSLFKKSSRNVSASTPSSVWRFFLNKLNLTFASFGNFSLRSCTWSQKGPSTSSKYKDSLACLKPWPCWCRGVSKTEKTKDAANDHLQELTVYYGHGDKRALQMQKNKKNLLRQYHWNVCSCVCDGGTCDRLCVRSYHMPKECVCERKEAHAHASEDASSSEEKAFFWVNHWKMRQKKNKKVWCLTVNSNGCTVEEEREMKPSMNAVQSSEVYLLGR